MQFRSLSTLVYMLLGSTVAVAADFSSPESALSSLEDAYARKDLAAVLAARDFEVEGRLLVSSMMKTDSPDEGLSKQAAEVLELSFRKSISTNGFPNFAGLRCRVVDKTEIEPRLVELIEECESPGGGRSKSKLHAYDTASGWRIVTLPRR